MRWPRAHHSAERSIVFVPVCVPVRVPVPDEWGVAGDAERRTRRDFGHGHGHGHGHATRARRAGHQGEVWGGFIFTDEFQDGLPSTSPNDSTRPERGRNQEPCMSTANDSGVFLTV